MMMLTAGSRVTGLVLPDSHVKTVSAGNCDDEAVDDAVDAVAVDPEVAADVDAEVAAEVAVVVTVLAVPATEMIAIAAITTMTITIAAATTFDSAGRPSALRCMSRVGMTAHITLSRKKLTYVEFTEDGMTIC
jgi:hypothetical protein